MITPKGLRHFAAIPKQGDEVIAAGNIGTFIHADPASDVACVAVNGHYETYYKTLLFQVPLAIVEGTAVYVGDRVYGTWEDADHAGYVVTGARGWSRQDDRFDPAALCHGASVFLTSDATHLTLQPPKQDRYIGIYQANNQLFDERYTSTKVMGKADAQHWLGRTHQRCAQIVKLES